MPVFETPSEHGDLYVEYNVVLPTELSPEMKKRTHTATICYALARLHVHLFRSLRSIPPQW